MQSCRNEYGLDYGLVYEVAKAQAGDLKPLYKVAA